MITVCRDATVANAVFNHPAVRPYVGRGTDPIDVGPLLDAGCIALTFDGGAFLFQPMDGRRLEVHSAALPEARGRTVIAAARDALRHVFEVEGAAVVTTECPLSNPRTKWLAHHLGFECVRRGEGYFGETDFMALSREQWRQSCQ